MSHRLTVLVVVWGVQITVGCIGLAIFKDRPDLRWLAWAPAFGVAVIATPLILLLPMED